MTTTINDSRTERLNELTDAAHREQVVAEALVELARTVESAPIPVAHYEPIWRAVSERLRRDARLAQRRALLATERLCDVRAAIEAHERWTPVAHVELHDDS